MAKPMDQYKWHELNLGCVIEDVGNAQEYKTGDWRSQKPVHDNTKCTRCALCWLFCPDSAVFEIEDEYFDTNLDSVSYTHLTLPTSTLCRSRWSPYN